MSEEERNKRADKIMADIEKAALEFSGTTAEGAEWSGDWLRFTDGEYYHRIRGIMLKYGMGEGDVEMIIANAWEDGWNRRSRHDQN